MCLRATDQGVRVAAVDTSYATMALGGVESARRASQDVMTTFTKPLADRLRGVTAQLVEGEPEHAISQFVDSNGVDLVVMGTVARSGIPGLVKGNTAAGVRVAGRSQIG